MIRTLLIILALPLIFLTAVAQAQTTVETAFILRTMIVPTADGGHSVTGMPVVKIDPTHCDAMVIEAEAAMHAVEDQEVLTLNRTGWVHKSYAGCLRVQMEVQVDPTVSIQTPVLCVREYVLGFDWLGECQP